MIEDRKRKKERMWMYSTNVCEREMKREERRDKNREDSGPTFH